MAEEEDLYRTAGFVASAGLKMWPARLSIAEEEDLYQTAGFVASARLKMWPAQLLIAEEELVWLSREGRERSISQGGRLITGLSSNDATCHVLRGTKGQLSC